MSDAVVLCAATSELLPAVVALMNRSFDPAFGEAWPQADLESAMGWPAVQLLCAIDRADPSMPLGFILSRTILDETEILLIAVAPEARRRGIGRRLLDAVIAGAKPAGVSVFLEVRADNSAALEMYRALNFKPVGVRRGYYNGADGIQRDSYTLRCNHSSNPAAL